jgi:hypothetical protein
MAGEFDHECTLLHKKDRIKIVRCENNSVFEHTNLVILQIQLTFLA